MRYRIAVTAALLLGGCSSMTPTMSVKQGYTIYDVKADMSQNQQLVKAITDAMKANTSRVSVVSAFPPSPLPDQAGRFKMASPFGGNLNALMQSAGAAATIPSCDNATVNITAMDTSMSSSGESTLVFACLMPYKGGYGLDIVARFSEREGGFSPQSMGTSLARMVVGDSSQFIPRTVKSIVDSVQATGVQVAQVEDYPLQ